MLNILKNTQSHLLVVLPEDPILQTIWYLTLCTFSWFSIQRRPRIYACFEYVYEETNHHVLGPGKGTRNM